MLASVWLHAWALSFFPQAVPSAWQRVALPYITGEYGGALFVLVYIFFLLVMGIPILTMEFSIGRASRRNMGDALRYLEPKGTHWHGIGWFPLVGGYCLMMFYIPVSAGSSPTATTWPLAPWQALIRTGYGFSSTTCCRSLSA